MSRVYEEAGPEQWLAVCAWVSSGSHVTEGTGDLPSISDFEERFCGRWARFRDYAEDLADQTGLAAGWPETATSYFNWDAWTRDLGFDYDVVDAPAPEFGVFIFHSLWEPDRLPTSREDSLTDPERGDIARRLSPQRR